MADATYDAVVIGGGGKSLVTAMYLAKYGGMKLAIFERRHELGGGWCTDEGPAPGFRADYHATGVTAMYNAVVQQDFPEWRELGGEIIFPRVGAGAIFKEDHSCIVFYSRKEDPEQKRSADSIARFSKRDAETWLRLHEGYDQFLAPAWMEYFHNPPPPPDIPDALERLVANPAFRKYMGYDPSWQTKTGLEVMRDIFESDAVIAALLKQGHSQHSIPPHMPGIGFFTAISTLFTPFFGFVLGGTHSWAHAAAKIIVANGGEFSTHSEVDKVLIENGKAKGIRLLDGTEIEARKAVVSGLDPHTLCFRLIGKEHFEPLTVRRIANLERRFGTLAWYTWAIHELPKYKAAAFHPDINNALALNLINKDPNAVAKQHDMRMLGQMPSELLLLVYNYVGDKTRAPEGKHVVLTEQYVPSATTFTEKQWLEFKKSHAEQVIRTWQEYSPNISWDNVIGYVPNTPLDHCKLANMAPEGEMSVISNTTSQFGRFRPVPELAGHKTPIRNLYATGSAWHPLGAGMSAQGYNCYKVIAQDLGLEKPWEKKGRLY